MDSKGYDEIRAEMVALFPAGRLEIGDSLPDLAGFDGKGWKNMADKKTGTLAPTPRHGLRSTARRVVSVKISKDGRCVYSTDYRYPVDVQRLSEHIDYWAPAERDFRWKPHPADVIACLFSDAQGCDQSFASWCADLGYDDDSIKARNAYDACQRCRDALLSIIDRATFDKLADLASQL